MSIRENVRRFSTYIGVSIVALSLLTGCSSEQAKDSLSAKKAPANEADNDGQEPAPSNQVKNGDTSIESPATIPPTEFTQFEMLQEIEAGAYDELHVVAFSPDGQTLVTAGGHVKFWKIGSAEPTVDISENFEDIQFGVYTRRKHVGTWLRGWIRLGVGCVEAGDEFWRTNP